MNEIINWTWQDIEKNWACHEFMSDQLLMASGRDVGSFQFTQNGRWLIATDSIQYDQFIWDNTMGEWRDPEDLDIED